MKDNRKAIWVVECYYADAGWQAFHRVYERTRAVARSRISSFQFEFPGERFRVVAYVPVQS